MKTKFGNARVDANGYYTITSRKEGNNNKRLHRLIWEDHYQAKIPENYIIHHINGDKTDNRIQNLQCVKEKNHLSYHNKGEKNPFYGKGFPKILGKKSREKMSKSLKKYCLFKPVGVVLHKNIRQDRKPWQSLIKSNQKLKSLGYYEDPWTAGFVYNFVLNEILKEEGI